jgi:hypothetical protein
MAMFYASKYNKSAEVRGGFYLDLHRDHRHYRNNVRRISTILFSFLAKTHIDGKPIPSYRCGLMKYKITIFAFLASHRNF